MITLADHTLIGAEGAWDTSRCPWRDSWQTEPSTNFGVRFGDVGFSLLVFVSDAAEA